MKKRALRKGDRVQMVVGRGVVYGRIVEFVGADRSFATVEKDDGAVVERLVAKLALVVTP